LNWPFPDLESFAGTEEDQLSQLRSLRDSIKMKAEQFFEENLMFGIIIFTLINTSLSFGVCLSTSLKFSAMWIE